MWTCEKDSKKRIQTKKKGFKNNLRNKMFNGAEEEKKIGRKET